MGILVTKYLILSCAHFTHTVVLNLDQESKASVVQTLKETESFAVTDGSRAMTFYRSYFLLVFYCTWLLIIVQE